MSAAALAADPSFPVFAQTFNMTEACYQPATASGAPSYTRTMTWDNEQQRSLYHIVNHAQGIFELQLKRCDLATQVFWDVKGVTGADPSTYTCSKMTAPAGGTIAFCPMAPFWPRAPKTYTFNGTDVIDGVSCNRFDFNEGMGAQSFWATATAPCRALVPQQRTDYTSFDATPPPASAFDGPAWLEGLKCTPVPLSPTLDAAWPGSQRLPF